MLTKLNFKISVLCLLFLLIDVIKTKIACFDVWLLVKAKPGFKIIVKRVQFEVGWLTFLCLKLGFHWKDKNKQTYMVNCEILFRVRIWPQVHFDSDFVKAVTPQ